MFKKGTKYDRYDLLEYVGSKQGQTGIIWGPKEPGVVICTSGGRHGTRAGYEDKLSLDNTCIYFGQGEQGDQDPNRFANRILVEGRRNVLLFKTREPRAAEVKIRGNYRKLYVFLGYYNVGSWEIFIPQEGKRKGNQLLKFVLVPVRDAFCEDSIQTEALPVTRDWESIRKQLQREGSQVKEGSFSLQEYYDRSEKLRQYAKQRAGGTCELCNSKAPFLKINNEPFLEVHHLLRLSDDGPDIPKNVAVLCPNCHREAHYGINSKKIGKDLVKIIAEKEAR